MEILKHVKQSVEITTAPAKYTMKTAGFLLTLPFSIISRPLIKYPKNGPNKVGRIIEKPICWGQKIAELSYTKQFVTNTVLMFGALYVISLYTNAANNFLQSFLPAFLRSSPVLSYLFTAAAVAFSVLATSLAVLGTSCAVQYLKNKNKVNYESGNKLFIGFKSQNYWIAGANPLSMVAAILTFVICGLLSVALGRSNDAAQRTCEPRASISSISSIVEDPLKPTYTKFE